MTTIEIYLAVLCINGKYLSRFKSQMDTITESRYFSFRVLWKQPLDFYRILMLQHLNCVLDVAILFITHEITFIMIVSHFPNFDHKFIIIFLLYRIFSLGMVDRILGSYRWHDIRFFTMFSARI